MHMYLAVDINSHSQLHSEFFSVWRHKDNTNTFIFASGRPCHWYSVVHFHLGRFFALSTSFTLVRLCASVSFLMFYITAFPDQTHPLCVFRFSCERRRERWPIYFFLRRLVSKAMWQCAYVHLSIISFHLRRPTFVASATANSKLFQRTGCSQASADDKRTAFVLSFSLPLDRFSFSKNCFV